MKGKVIEKEHHSQFEPFQYRYRRAAGSVDDKKLSCTLKMRVRNFVINYCLLMFT